MRSAVRILAAACALSAGCPLWAGAQNPLVASPPNTLGGTAYPPKDEAVTYGTKRNSPPRIDCPQTAAGAVGPDGAPSQVDTGCSYSPTSGTSSQPVVASPGEVDTINGASGAAATRQIPR